MKLKVKCPHCNEELLIVIENGKLVSISKNEISLELSEDELSKLARENGIEFG